MTAPQAANQATHQPSKPFRKTPLFTPYVVVWAMFGALSFGYLSILALAPEWLEDLRPSGMTADPQNNQGQRAAARLASDVNGLQNSVAQIQLDLAQIKTDLETQSDRGKSVEGKVGAIEQKLTPNPAIEAAAPQAVPAETPVPAAAAVATGDAPQQTSSVATTTLTTSEIATAIAAPVNDPVVSETAAQPTVLNAAPPAPAAALETGSVNKAPKTAGADAISFGPAIVKPAAKPLGVQISSGASVDSLRLSWSLLSDKHGDTLKNMQPRVVASGDEANPSFNLVAGPVKSRVEAAKVCKALAARNVPCKIGAFAGEAL